MTIRVHESDKLMSILIVATFSMSRFLFYHMGIRFDASGLDWFYQYLDIEILRHNLVQSVYLQHGQPPIFNLFLGAVLKIFPANYEYVFALVYFFCGLTLYYQIYKILCFLCFHRWTAFATATFFIVSPEAILYQNWLYCTWPVATLLALAAHRLLLFEKTYQLKHVVQFLIIISLVCLTRSMFHLIYLLACVALVLLMQSPIRKKIGVVSVVAVLLVGSVYAKNAVLFGVYGSSSWEGMNLAKITSFNKFRDVPASVADPEVTSVVACSHLAEYPKKYSEVPSEYSKYPVLALARKNNGHQNLNHYGYIAISREYRKAASYEIMHDFPGYSRKVINAWRCYSKPAWDYTFLRGNLSEIPFYMNVMTLSKPRKYAEKHWLGIESDKPFPYSTRLIIPMALILVVGIYIISVIKAIRGRTATEHWAFFTFLVMTILYVAILGNSAELGENHRFRVQTDPLLYIATLVCAREAWRMIRNLAKTTPPTEANSVLA